MKDPNQTQAAASDWDLYAAVIRAAKEDANPSLTQAANFVSTSTFTVTGRPNYCSNCGMKIGSGWNYCGGCGRGIASAPQMWPTGWPSTMGGMVPMSGPNETCAYDGLPPGNYHLACNCPKHRINL